MYSLPFRLSKLTLSSFFRNFPPLPLIFLILGLSHPTWRYLIPSTLFCSPSRLITSSPFFSSFGTVARFHFPLFLLSHSIFLSLMYRDFYNLSVTPLINLFLPHFQLWLPFYYFINLSLLFSPLKHSSTSQILFPIRPLPNTM